MIIHTNLINHLILQIVQTKDNSLYHGRMGVVLALCCYGKAYHDNRLCEYALDILSMKGDDYYNGDIGVENGLSGLGIGFTLLNKAGMFKADLNDVLYEIDNKIMGVDPRRIKDMSFRNGAAGIFYYIKTRLSIEEKLFSIDCKYITELKENIKANTKDWPIGETLLGNIRQPAWGAETYLDKPIGIDNGSAYYLMKESYGKVLSY